MEVHMSPIAPLWNDDMVQESSAARNNEAPAIPFADVFQSAIDSEVTISTNSAAIQFVELSVAYYTYMFAFHISILT